MNNPIKKNKKKAPKVSILTATPSEYIGYDLNAINPQHISNTELQIALKKEAKARIAADITLQKNIDAEVKRATTAEKILQASLKQEISDRETADTTLQANIDTETERATAAEEALTTALKQEISDRETADTTLQANIDAGIERTTEAEETLQANIDTKQDILTAGDGIVIKDNVISTDTLYVTVASYDALEQIESPRTNCIYIVATSESTYDEYIYVIYSIGGLWEKIGSESDITLLQAALKQEISDRETTDTTLQANIDAEVERATEAEETLTVALEQEISDREAADTTLQTNIDAEAERATEAEEALTTALEQEILDRETADTTLQTNINAEVERATAAEETLQANIDTKQDTLTAGDGIVIEDNIISTDTLYVTVANYDALEQIESPRTNCIYIVATSESTYNEYIYVTSNESAIWEKIGSESDITLLQAALAQEISDREAADTTLQTNIDAETERATEAEEVLTAALAQEISDREAADTTLQTNIDAEAERATEAEEVLTTALEQEISDREAADTTLQIALEEEATRAITVEETLQANIDTKQDTLTAGDGIVIEDNIISTDTLYVTVASYDALEQIESPRTNCIYIVATSESTYDEYIYIVFDEGAIWEKIGSESDITLLQLLQAALEQEISDRETADTTLQTNIDAEVERATEAEETLQANIDTKQDTLTAGDGIVIEDNVISTDDNYIVSLNLILTEDEIDAIIYKINAQSNYTGIATAMGLI